MEAHNTGTWLRRARAVGTAVLVVAYPLVSYRANVARHAEPFDVLFAFVPLLVLSFGAAWTGRPRGFWLTVWGAACLVLWRYRAPIAAHYSWVYLVEDVAMLLLLCSVFARTLGPSRTPLVSRLSLLVHGSLSPFLVRYTRRVTQVWAALFGAMAIASVLLFLVAGVRVWALYANVLAWPIMILVFVGEYLVRRVVVPPEERTGFLQVVFAGRRHWHNLMAGERRAARHIPQ